MTQVEIRTARRDPPATREIANDDLRAAIRGLGMYGRTDARLRELVVTHAASPLFASRVIAEAAGQVLAGRRVLGIAR